ncbi:uncharacterized protein LOC135492699 [Lineus longissimus]|uniref:uncharacterized protein LOC135492699 n=1 Tax=Lineus longissimus TaxID=88925 RepID=UPI00315CFF89
MWTTQVQLCRLVSRSNNRNLQKSAENVFGKFQQNKFGSTHQNVTSLLNQRTFVTLTSIKDDLLSPVGKSSTHVKQRKMDVISSNLSLFSASPLPLAQSFANFNQRDSLTKRVNFFQRAHLFGSGAGKERQFDFVHTCKHTDDRWPIKETLVETCGEIYEDDPYHIKFSTSYIDTGARGHEECQTVMMVHGAPGSHHDFVPIIDILVTKGIRVIAPNMPGYGFTKGLVQMDDEAFIQSTEERTDFLLDFLSEIGVPKIDMIVAHSSGSSAALKILSQSNKVKALTTICPLPHNLECIETYLFVKSLASKQDSLFWKNIAKKYVRNKSTQFGFTAEDPRHMMQALLAISNSQFRDIGSFAMSLSLKHVPVLAVYTDDDRFISPDKAAEFLDLLGISPHRVATLDVGGGVETSGVDFKGYPRGVKLNAGGHHPHLKYPQFFAEEILKFLEYLSSKDSSL